MAVAEDRLGRGREQQVVQLHQGGLGGLVGAPAQLHGQAHVPAGQLSLVHQARPGQREERRGGGPQGLAPEGLGGAGLVVVLEEAQEAVLVAGLLLDVAQQPGGVVAAQAVVDALVVGQVEALQQQLGLEVPVGLGHEQEAGVLGLDRPDQARPVLLGRWRPHARAPGAGEDRVEHQHGHVAAQAVALPGQVE